MSTVEYQTSLSAISGYMLTEIRKSMNLAQSDMGKLFNMSHATYRSIEKGETAINADFIFMLSGFLDFKYSFYFEIIEDIANQLTSTKKDFLNNDCVINLIPNGDFQKLLVDNNDDTKPSLAPSTGRIYLLHGQDLNFFLTPEIRIKIIRLNDKVIMKDQAKEIIKITSDEVGVVINELSKQEQDENGFTFGASSLAMGGATTSATALLALTVSPYSLPVLAGLGLYKAYKKSKEDKKK